MTLIPAYVLIVVVLGSNPIHKPFDVKSEANLFSNTPYQLDKRW